LSTKQFANIPTVFTVRNILVSDTGARTQEAVWENIQTYERRSDGRVDRTE